MIIEPTGSVVSTVTSLDCASVDNPTLLAILSTINVYLNPNYDQCVCVCAYKRKVMEHTCSMLVTYRVVEERMKTH